MDIVLEMVDYGHLVDRRTALKALGSGAIATSTGIAGCLGSGDENVTLRYAHPNGPDTIVGRFADGLADFLDEETEGRLTLDVFPNSELGGVSEMIEGTSDGSIDMGHNDFAALAQLYDDLAVFNTPFLFENTDHAMSATNPNSSEVLAGMNEDLSQEGNVRVLGSAYYGYRHLTSNTKITSPSDMEGLKFRAIPLDIWIAMIEGMGAEPQPVDFSELSSALATGVVDGQENPLTTINEHSFYEHQKYLILTGHMLAVLAVYMNENSWQSLSEDDQGILERGINELRSQSVEWGKTEEEANLEELSSHMEVIDESAGLDVNAFQTQVLEHVRSEFPDWDDYISTIKN